MSGADRLEMKKAQETGDTKKSLAENQKLLAQFNDLVNQLNQGNHDQESQDTSNEEWMARIRKEGSGL